MFVIKGPSKSELMHNRIEDDFLQFMPRHMGCGQGELEIFYFGDDVRAKMKNYKKLGAIPAIGADGSLSAVIKKPGHFVEIEGEESQYVPESIEVLETFQGRRVVEWPYRYDAELQRTVFTGHKLEGA